MNYSSFEANNVTFKKNNTPPPVRWPKTMFANHVETCHGFKSFPITNTIWNSMHTGKQLISFENIPSIFFHFFFPVYWRGGRYLMCNLFHSAKVLRLFIIWILTSCKLLGWTLLSIKISSLTSVTRAASSKVSWWQNMQSLKLFSKLSSKYLLAFVDYFAQIQRIICYLIQIYFLVIDILSPTQICFEKISNLLITPTSLNLLSTNDTWQFNPRIPHHFISV